MKTHCKRGHARTPENLTTQGQCRTCVNDSQMQRYHGGPLSPFMPVSNGEVFDKWTVQEYKGDGKYLCRCECGVVKKIPGSGLKDGTRTACRSCSSRHPDSGFREVLNRYKNNARHRGVEWELSEQQLRILVTSPCHYCGLPSSMERNGFVFNGVDRVDNSLGYTPDNSVPCCKVCNHMKHVLTEEEFLAHIKRIYEHRRPA